VFAALNGGPDWVFGPAWTVMQLGTVGAAAVVGLVTGYALRRPTLALVFAVTPIVAWFAARVVKDLVARGRPAAEGLVTTIRGTVDDGFGFPSGHSTVAFALATVVTPALPRRWRALPFVLATAVALARPYVGAHLPLDLVGGAALGVLVGLAGHGVTVLVSRRAGSPGA
jgi:undecaprenyl-diphosphatase